MFKTKQLITHKCNLTELVCFQELEVLNAGLSLQGLATGLELPNLLRVAPTAKEFYKKTFQTYRYMTISGHITQQELMETALFCLVGSPAKTSLALGNEQDLKEQDQVFSLKLFDSFIWYDRDSSSWKTYQTCLLSGWETYLQSFPCAGLMQSGRVSVQPRWVQFTDAIASGSSPTQIKSQVALSLSEVKNPDFRLPTSDFRLVQMLPTPVASDATTGAIIGKEDTFKMTKNGNLRKYNRHGTNGSLGLARHVQMLPTPKAVDGEHPGVRSHSPGQTLHLSAAVMPKPGGKLSPTFVEALMGYPKNWTEIT